MNPVTNPKSRGQIPCWLFFLEKRGDLSSKLVLSRDQTSKLVPNLHVTIIIVICPFRLWTIAEVLGDDFYSMGADVWSSGCILAELLLGKAPFQGDSEIGQIHEIFKQLGTPEESTWPGISKNKLFRTTFPNWVRQPTKVLYPGVSSDSAIKLMESIFVYDQEKRVSTKDILNSSFIADACSRFRFMVPKQSANYH